LAAVGSVGCLHCGLVVPSSPSTLRSGLVLLSVSLSAAGSEPGSLLKLLEVEEPDDDMLSWSEELKVPGSGGH
jgi:hypothetical protein